MERLLDGLVTLGTAAIGGTVAWILNRVMNHERTLVAHGIRLTGLEAAREQPPEESRRHR